MKTLRNLGDICAIQLQALRTARVSEDLNKCRNCNEEARYECDLYIPISRTELGFRKGENAYVLLK